MDLATNAGVTASATGPLSTLANAVPVNRKLENGLRIRPHRQLKRYLICYLSVNGYLFWGWKQKNFERFVELTKLFT